MEADKKAARKTKWGSLAACVTAIDWKLFGSEIAYATHDRDPIARKQRETIKRNNNLWVKAKIAKALKKHKNTFNRRCRDIRAANGREANFFYVSHHINDEKPVYK